MQLKSFRFDRFQALVKTFSERSILCSDSSIKAVKRCRRVRIARLHSASQRTFSEMELSCEIFSPCVAQSTLSISLTRSPVNLCVRPSMASWSCKDRIASFGSLLTLLLLTQKIPHVFTRSGVGRSITDIGINAQVHRLVRGLGYYHEDLLVQDYQQ